MKLVPRKLRYELPKAVGRMVDVVVMYHGDTESVAILLHEMTPEDLIKTREKNPGILGTPAVYAIVADHELHIYPPSSRVGTITARYYPAMVLA